MRDFRVFIAAMWAAASLSCGERVPDDPVILEIGGRAVSYSQLEVYIEKAVEEQAPFTRGELKARLLEQFIEEQLLLIAAEEEGIRVDPQEVEALAGKMSSVAGGTNGEAAADLEAERAAARLDFESHIRVRKLIEKKVLNDVTVDEGEIAAHYEQNSAYYKQPETIDISQILVESEDEANRIREELEASSKRFEELARQYSEGPEASRDGHLGTFRRGELPPDFEEVVFGLRKGRLSDVVKTDFGYHIFRINEVRRARDLSLEEVEDAIRVELLRQKSDEALVIYIDELKKRYPVTIHTDRLDFPYMDREARAEGIPSQRATPFGSNRNGR
jgi:parvulin-like peptidyl-prolyl isomerase